MMLGAWLICLLHSSTFKALLVEGSACVRARISANSGAIHLFCRQKFQKNFRKSDPMSGNTIGTLFTVTSFGESHGPAIGCVVDGCPPGLAICEADIQAELDRRKPGTSRHVTQRREPDEVEILSGVFEGKTTGTPIALLIRNQDQRSHDYSNIAQSFRPGHADYGYTQKYGFRDYRGGGLSSARETAVRVAAGAIARKWLQERYGIEILGWMSALGPIDIPFVSWDDVTSNPFFAPNNGK